jgi:putative copper export protein
MDVLEYSFLFLHIVCASFWFGSYLWTEIVLWPRLRAEGELERIQPLLRNVRGRQLNAAFIFGTILSGYALGLVNGAFQALFSAYGIFFVLGAVTGISMLVWWASFPPRSMRWSWRTYYSGFWVVIALMVAMRTSAT